MRIANGAGPSPFQNESVIAISAASIFSGIPEGAASLPFDHRKIYHRNRPT